MLIVLIILLAVGCGGDGPAEPAPPAREAAVAPEPRPAEPVLPTRKLDLRVDLSVPEVVVVGRPFYATARGENIGEVTLSGVTLSLRGYEGLRMEPGPMARRVEGVTLSTLTADALEPGGILELSVRLVPEQEGVLQAAANAREERGWAAASAHASVMAVTARDGDPTEPARCEGIHVDLEVGLTTSKARVGVGETLYAFVAVTNDGEVPLTDLVAAVRGTGGIQAPANEPLRRTIPRLEPGATRTFRFPLVATEVGAPRIDASARDPEGWAAAGAFLGLRVR